MIFIRRGHTGGGVIISVPAGKVSTRHVLFLAGNFILALSLLQYMHSCMIMYLLFGFRYLGCQRFLK